MPNIFKRFANVTADKYVFTDAAALPIQPDTPPAPEPEEAPQEGEAAEAPPEPEPQTPVDFAQVQAEAILADARREADALMTDARQAVAEELETLRQEAAAEGYKQGFQEGQAAGRLEARQQQEVQALRLEEQVKSFLDAAAREKDRMLEKSQNDLKELALTIAEKVIRVSLRSSSDILIRMIESATAKKRRCEWVQIYIADCDARTSVSTVPELAEAMRHLSDRVRIIPMADDESGTCIIEMPDEIIDASVSTQLDNLRGVLENAEVDREDRR